MLAAVPDAVVAVDIDGLIVYVNEQAESLFGWPKADLLGQRVEVLVPDQQTERHSTLRSAFFARPDDTADGERAGPVGPAARRHDVRRRDQPQRGERRRRAVGAGDDPRRHRLAQVRARPRSGPAGGGAGERGQGRVPVADEPRAAHPAQRDPRVRAVAGHGRAERRPRRVRRPDHPCRWPPVGAGRRGPRHLPARPGLDAVVAGARHDQRGRRRGGGHAPAAGRPPRRRPRPHADRLRPRDRRPPTSEAGRHQPRRQRRQVQP